MYKNILLIELYFRNVSFIFVHVVHQTVRIQIVLSQSITTTIQLKNNFVAFHKHRDTGVNFIKQIKFFFFGIYKTDRIKPTHTWIRFKKENRNKKDARWRHIATYFRISHLKSHSYPILNMSHTQSTIQRGNAITKETSSLLQTNENKSECHI